MNRSIQFLRILFLVELLLFSTDSNRLWAEENSPQKVEFIKQIQPIFLKNCHSCHGDKYQKGGFRLDQKEEAFRGGDSGRTITPGNSETSLLFRRISGFDGPDEIMPPPKKQEPLTDSQIQLIKNWIDQGAVWPKTTDTSHSTQKVSSHWAFQPIHRPLPPRINSDHWPRNPIDYFVLAKLEKNGIAPSSEANKRTLIRRHRCPRRRHSSISPSPSVSSP